MNGTSVIIGAAILLISSSAVAYVVPEEGESVTGIASFIESEPNLEHTSSALTAPGKAKEFRELQRVAASDSANSADAHYLLARIYGDQRLPESKRDYSSSLSHLRQALERNPDHGPALLWMAVALDFGLGVQEDNSAAMELYERAGAQGQGTAYHNLAAKYAHGKEVV